MRSGDTVLHRPSGETWVVAYVRDNDIAWFGWPEGVARTSDCEVVKACSDEEHETSLRVWASDVYAGDIRHINCRRQLAELLGRREELPS